jgi:hypothetical protein
VLDTVLQLNDKFAILAIEGVLSMLNSKGGQEVGLLGRLAASSDATVLQDVLEDVGKLAGWIVQRWWKMNGLSEALRRLEAANATTVCGTNSQKLMT